MIIPKEGDIYKILSVGEHIFELRYGYYESFERERGEPVVLYPDLKSNSLYDHEGCRIVTAVQDACEHYSALKNREQEGVCSECIYYPESDTDIGICTCKETRRV